MYVIIIKRQNDQVSFNLFKGVNIEFLGSKVI